MELLNIALIGCGRIAYKHVEAIANNYPQAKLVAVCDLVEERAGEKAQAYLSLMKKKSLDCSNPTVYIDYKSLLHQEEIDIVAIATESGNHAQISLDCLGAGKHVIVEKPMALSTRDADLMISCAKENNVKLCVSHQNRFNLTIQKLRKAVEEGRFGRIIAGNARVLWNRNRDYYLQAPWRGTYAQDGGCLMNQCIHNIDLLQWMLGGEPSQIQAMVDNYLHPYIEAEDYGTIQIKFANGSIGNVEGTVCVFPKNLEETLTILGEWGTVVIGGSALNKVLVWDFADGKDNISEIQQDCNREIENIYGMGHTPLYLNMINSIHNNQEPLINGEEGKKAMSIILHAYLSSKLQKRIEFNRKNIEMIKQKD